MNESSVEGMSRPRRHDPLAGRRFPWIVAGLVLVLELVPAGNYGIAGDELYFIACSEHLDFGYVDHPPLVAVLTWISRAAFGDSLRGLRLLPALAGAATVVLASAMARRLGGGRFAGGLAALTTASAVAILALCNYMSMNAFDILLVTVCAYLLVSILDRTSPGSWLLLGLFAGIGLQNKLTMLAFGLAAFVGLVLAHPRALAGRWPWLGGALALAIFLPHVIWQAVNDWPTLEFIRRVQEHRNPSRAPVDFLAQVSLALNPATAPIWIGGLIGLWIDRPSRRFRPLGVTAVAFLAVYVFQNSQVYYVVPVFPLLFAAGGVVWERLTARSTTRWIRPCIAGALMISGAGLAPLAVPLLPVERFISYSSTIGLLDRVQLYDRLKLPIHFGFRFGWPEMARTVSRAYGDLPEEDRARCVLLANDYSKAGAINYYGARDSLPHARSGHLSCWSWGPGEQRGEVAISIGYDEAFLREIYGSVTLAAVFRHPYVMPWETDQPVYVCRIPVAPIQEVWPRFRSF